MAPNTGSVAIWFYVSDLSEMRTIVMKSMYSDCCEMGALVISPDASLLYVTKDGNDNSGRTTDPGVITQGHWYHLCVTGDDNNAIKFYLNGEELETYPRDGVDSGKRFFDDGTEWKIGRYFNANNDPGTSHFAGVIDEVRLYDYPLSEQEIQSLYNECTPEAVDSLTLPSIIAQPCDDECAVQAVDVSAAQELGGVTIPIAIPDSVTVCSLSTAGLVTESWDFQTLDVKPDSGFIFISLFNTQGLVIDSGTTTVANIYFNAPRQCSETPGQNANYFIHWDTTLSEDPSRALLFSDPSGAEEIHPGFDPNRDSTEIVDFLMGDCDDNGALDIADLVCLVGFMFQGDEPPCIMASLNINGVGGIEPNISDLVYLVAYMFSGGPAPICPGPGAQVARLTPTDDIYLKSACDAHSTSIAISSETSLLGIELELVGTGNGEPVSGLQNDNIEVVHGHEGDRIKVGVLDMQGAYPIAAGEHVLLEIPGQWEIVSALAADQNFQTIQPSLGRIEPELPREFSLGQNYPNPFNPSTEINFALPTACDVSLEIYNITGQRVTTLVDAYLEAGQHSVLWDAWSNASGVYFYRLTAGEFTETKKMMLLK